jgi:hypothetical protein
MIKLKIEKMFKGYTEMVAGVLTKREHNQFLKILKKLAPEFGCNTDEDAIKIVFKLSTGNITFSRDEETGLNTEEPIDSDNEFDAIITMTDDEAADIIADMQNNIIPARGNGKSITSICNTWALSKAIIALHERSKNNQKGGDIDD